MFTPADSVHINNPDINTSTSFNADTNHPKFISNTKLATHINAKHTLKDGVVLMIDNHDSFTYNIVQYLQMLGQTVVVWQNNTFKLKDVDALAPKAIVIGPGPGRPEDAGQTSRIINAVKNGALKKCYPILGVCLGHQAIGQAFGATVTHARQIMHGRVSDIYHHNQGVFKSLPDPYPATRYHSLVIDKHSLPECLQITAWTQNMPNSSYHLAHYSIDTTIDHCAMVDEVMGICHQSLPIEGVQFHPESILSEQGLQLLVNFLQTYCKL